MITFNIDNLVINRAIAGVMRDKTTTQPMFYLNQIQEPSLETSGEAADVVDAQGIKIASFDRSKTASLSGSSALVNLGLAAAQFGGEKIIASEKAKIEVPAREIVTVKDGKATLKCEDGDPISKFPITFINEMTKDGGLGTPYTLKDSVEGAEYTFEISGKDLTITCPEYTPTGGGAAKTTPPDGTKFIVFYKVEKSTGVKVENSAEMFAKGGEFILEVLLADICDPNNTAYHGYIIFPNAKMSNETTLDLNNEATHGFTIEAMQDYCDDAKKLFEIIVTD